MVKIELRKRDAVWIVLLVVFIGVGFVYAYTTDDSGNPAIMGHSADELELPAGSGGGAGGGFVTGGLYGWCSEARHPFYDETGSATGSSGAGCGLNRSFTGIFEGLYEIDNSVFPARCEEGDGGVGFCACDSGFSIVKIGLANINNNFYYSCIKQ